MRCTMKLRNKETTIISLPTEVSKASEKLSDYGMLFYGVKKIGKTSFCTQFEKAFFMMCEPGAKSFSIYQRPILNWLDFKTYVKLLEKDRTFKTIVVDPVDLLYKLCLKSVCEKLVIEHPSEEDWGKGWQAVGDEFTFWINRLMSIGKGVIFLSHSVPKDIKNRKGETRHKISPTMPGQAWAVLEGVIDLWVYMGYDEDGKRIFQLQGDDNVGAGHNLDSHFQYPMGEPIETIPMGKNKEEAYRNFILAFNNELKKEEEEDKVKSVKKLVKIKLKK